MTEQSTERTPDRSPRFPFIGLSKALERAEVLHDSARTHPVPVPDAVKKWGYSEKSSGGFQTISALKLYGLLEDTGAGNARKVRISDAVRKYFLDERPDHKAAARKSFARKPKILDQLWREWGTSPPDEAFARSMLKLDMGFTESAAKQLVDIYKDNLSFAGLGDDNTTSESVSDNQSSDSGTGTTLGAEQPVRPPAREQRPPVQSGEWEYLRGQLSADGSTAFRLMVKGEIGEAELDKILRMIRLQKLLFAEVSEPFDTGEREEREPA